MDFEFFQDISVSFCFIISHFKTLWLKLLLYDSTGWHWAGSFGWVELGFAHLSCAHACARVQLVGQLELTGL